MDNHLNRGLHHPAHRKEVCLWRIFSYNQIIHTELIFVDYECRVGFNFYLSNIILYWNCLSFGRQIIQIMLYWIFFHCCNSLSPELLCDFIFVHIVETFRYMCVMRRWQAQILGRISRQMAPDMTHGSCPSRPWIIDDPSGGVLHLVICIWVHQDAQAPHPSTRTPTTQHNFAVCVIISIQIFPIFGRPSLY